MKIKKPQVAVLGLGRFGQSLVENLSRYDVDILACDKDEERLQAVADYTTHLVQADVSDEDAMEKLGLGNFDIVVLAIGADIKSSILAAITAKELGAKFLVAKAFGHREKKIYEQVGADMVVVPEEEMGAKIAHRLMRPNLIDILEDKHHFQITEMFPLDEWVGESIRESEIRERYRTTILAILRNGKTIMPVMPDEIIQADDNLIALCEPGTLD